MTTRRDCEIMSNIKKKKKNMRNDLDAVLVNRAKKEQKNTGGRKKE